MLEYESVEPPELRRTRSVQQRCISLSERHRMRQLSTWVRSAVVIRSGSGAVSTGACYCA